MGRDAVLKQLEQQLQTSERVAISTLTGMGGIGKTELALQYALEDTDKPPEMRRYQGGICWLNAQGESNIGIQLLRFVTEYLQIKMPDEGTLEERVAIGWQRWREGETLIIFDDVQEIKQIEPYLPPQENRFKVIITTRNQRISRNFALLPVELLSLEASLELLASLIGENTINQDKTTAEALCQWLGRLPLGIELVGRYIRETEEDLATVFESLKALKLTDKSLDYPTDEIMTAKRGVAAAFKLSWQQLSEAARTLAMALSLFALAPIPAEMFLQEEGNLEQTQENLRNLKNLSLIKDIGDKIYEIHPLIWHYLRAKLDEFTEAESLKHHHCELMAVIAQKIPEEPIQADIEALRLAIPHLALTAEELHPWLTEDDLIVPYIALGNFYKGQGFYQQAQSWYEDCLSIAQNRLGAEHPKVATSLNSFAVLYLFQGKYEAAEPLLQQALEMSQKLLGAEHPEVPEILNNLAFSYHYQGKYKLAEQFFLQGLEMSQKLLGAEHPEVAEILNNLALLYQSQGKYEAAETFSQQALEMTQKIYGEDHLSVALSLNNLACSYQFRGKYEAAQSLFQKALEMYEKLLGKEHHFVAINLNNLAESCSSQGKYEDAESLSQKALEILQKLFGREHPQVAINLNNIAKLYELQEKYEAAESLIKQALEINQKLLGTEHPSVAISLNNMAKLYELQEKYEAAERLYLQALEMKQKLLGTEHPSVAIGLNNLALLYDKQRKYAAAITYFQDAIGIFRQLLGDNHPNTQTSINSYLKMLREAPEEEVLPLINIEWRELMLRQK